MHQSIKKEKNVIRLILQGYKNKQLYLNVFNRASWFSLFLQFLWVNKIIYGYMLCSHFSTLIYLKYVKNTLKILPRLNFKFYNNNIYIKQNPVSIIKLKNLFLYEKNLLGWFKK